MNSYKRLVPGYDAPTELTWTKNNQNSLIRISNLRSDSLAIELRSPDASANPYLVFAVCIAAGLDGIQQKLYPVSYTHLKRDFYQYYATMMEPWDGPASILFSDGDVMGAVLDRNGLRPSRYYVTSDGCMILSSEVGVLPVPEEKIILKERLHPGKWYRYLPDVYKRQMQK